MFIEALLYVLAFWIPWGIIYSSWHSRHSPFRPYEPKRLKVR